MLSSYLLSDLRYHATIIGYNVVDYFTTRYLSFETVEKYKPKPTIIYYEDTMSKRDRKLGRLRPLNWYQRWHMYDSIKQQVRYKPEDFNAYWSNAYVFYNVKMLHRNKNWREELLNEMNSHLPLRDE